MNKVYLLLACVSVSISTMATDCVFDKVSAIQAQQANVLVYLTKNGVGSFWKNIGTYDEKHLVSYQSLAQQSHATGSQVVLRFPDGYDCYKTDYSTVPFVFRLQ